MHEIVNTQKVVDNIKRIKNLSSDKEVAALLGLTAADFSNRKKRGTLIPLIIEWAIKDDLDLNDLITGKLFEEGDDSVSGKHPDCRDIYLMTNGKTPKEWLIDTPVGDIILSDKYCKDMVLVKMIGTSMEPTICDGAIFSVDHNVSAFASGQVFVIWIPLDGPVVRRVFIDLEKCILKADNQKYPDIMIPIRELPEKDFILGRVRWVLQPI